MITQLILRNTMTHCNMYKKQFKEAHVTSCGDGEASAEMEQLNVGCWKFVTYNITKEDSFLFHIFIRLPISCQCYKNE